MSALIPSPVDAKITSAHDVCREVVDLWRATRYPDTLFEEETRMAAGRVNSWISPASVSAGVMDIFSAARSNADAMSKDAINELAAMLGKRLFDEGLLIAQSRRGGSLASNG